MLEVSPDRIALGITYYVVLLFSLSVHESAHAWTASRLGDDTALRLGRVSLNPLVHIDPIGTVLMPALQFFLSGIPLLAWAKPTPYDPRNFAPGWHARGHVCVAGAGPLSNVLLALLFTVGMFAAARAGLVESGREITFIVLAVGIQLNVVLALFNLLPLPPLDGATMASWGLPRPIADRYDRLVGGFGPWLLLLVLFPLGGVLGRGSRYITALLYSLVF